MKVSVILPVYNGAKYLSRCFEMLSAQTFKDFEVIAVDDGSTDDSGKILDCAKVDFSLKVIHQANQGAGGARNSALKAAQGEYIWMADVDDIYNPDLLKIAVNTIEAKQSDFCLFNHIEVLQDDIDVAIDRWNRSKLDTPRIEVLPCPALKWFVLNRHTGPAPWQFLFKRESVIGKKFIPKIMFEDNPFVYSYLALENRGVLIDTPMYGYVQSPYSVMRSDNELKKMDSAIVVMRHMREALPLEMYRFLAKKVYFNIVKCLYKRVHESRLDAVFKQALDEFIHTIMADKLLIRQDCKLKYFLKFLWISSRHKEYFR